ncbi:hypothetical protein PORY_002043 [Pneumocystis oryctolagi]|uniref:Uncharacterized protein n=1 Tax=Pneumocystis oryctolagi TaxID=42067 RepID=A0ACB7CB84_9ASCO|nr:hypothetical protein PORY_002043 [Pneumocystis oryctolagi]
MKSSGWLATLIQGIERLYPKSLADTTWDNVGLLLESPVKNPGRKRVLLAIDLTTSVAEEALAMDPPVGAIIAYRRCSDPVIFSPIKSLTLNDPRHKMLLRLATSGISVYSPHTAMDAAAGGINDWLADGISDEKCVERTVIVPTTHNGKYVSNKTTGMGRIVRWEEPIAIATLVKRIKKHLQLNNIQLALSEKHRKENNGQVYKIGICAGSGGSILRDVHADVLFTGELSHHDILNATEKGISVILCGHSNTERGFLSCIMKKRLQEVLCEEFRDIVDDKILLPEVVVSKADKDPLEIV